MQIERKIGLKIMLNIKIVFIAYILVIYKESFRLQNCIRLLIIF